MLVRRGASPRGWESQDLRLRMVERNGAKLVSYQSGDVQWKAVGEILRSVRLDPSVKASNMIFYPSFICLLLLLQIPVQTLSASSERPSSGK